MRRPHSIADRSRDVRDLSKRNDDRLSHENFRLPVQEARTKARQVLDESAVGGLYDHYRKLASTLRRSDRICRATVADRGLIALDGG